MDFEGSALNWAKLMIELDAGWSLMVDQKMRLEEQLMEVQGREGRIKDKYLKLKGKRSAMEAKFDSEKMKWREERQQIRDEYWKLYLEKKILDLDFKSQNIDGDLKLRAAEAEVERLKSSLEDKEEKILVLGREKEQLVVQVAKLEKEKSDEAESCFSVKKRLEEVETKNYELVKSIEFGAVERATNAIEDGVYKLNRLNKELEEKLSRANLEKDAEIGRIFKKRRVLNEGGEMRILETDGVIQLQVLYEESKTHKNELQPNSTSLNAEFAHPINNVIGTPPQN